MRKVTRRTGFTLVELLVVIGIIMTLAGILFPVFAQAREKTRQTSCLSNTRQIGTAIHLYLQDYDETFPFSDDFGSPQYRVQGSPIQTGHLYWGDLIFPYLKNTGGSGMSTGEGTRSYGPVQRCPAVWHWYTGYAYNIQLGYYPNGQLGDFSSEPYRLGVSRATLSRPAELIVLMDNSVPYAWMRNNLGYPHEPAYLLTYRWFPKPKGECLACYDWPRSGKRVGHLGAGVVSGRHNGGVNGVFADGHARWIRTGEDLCRPERGFPKVELQ